MASVSPTAPTLGQPANQYSDNKTSQDAMMGIGAGLSGLPEGIDNKAWGHTAFSDNQGQILNSMKRSCPGYGDYLP